MAKSGEAAREWAAEVEWEVRKLTNAQEGIKADMEAVKQDMEAAEARKAQDADKIKEAQEALDRLTDEQREKVLQSLASLRSINTAQKDLYRETLRRMEEIMGTVTETVNQSLKAFAPVIKSINDSAIKMRESAEIWALLAPYVKAETEEHPEIYGDDEHPDIGEDVPLEALIAAAAKRARAAGVDVPRLEAEETEKEIQRRKKISKALEARNVAKESGALIEYKKLATIANRELGFKYFATEVLALLPPEAKDFLVNDETGEVDLYALMQTSKGKLPDVESINTGFLMFLLSVAAAADLRETNTGKKNTIVGINIPDALSKMNIDPRPNVWNPEKKKYTRVSTDDPAQTRFDCFMEMLKPILPIGAYFGKNREKLYSVASFIERDKETETIYLTIPYMFALVEYANLHVGKHPAIVYLFHANIVNENPAAVEIASRIAIGVVYRGVTRSQENTYMSQEKRKPTKYKRSETKPDGSKVLEEYTYEPEQPDKLIKRTKELDDGSTLEVVYKDKKPKIIEWSESFNSLLKDCKQAQREIDKIGIAKGPQELALIEAAKKTGTLPDPQAIADARKTDHKNDPQKRNNKIKDLFDAAIRIIMQKSDMPDYYKDFEIGRRAGKRGEVVKYKAPTNSTLRDELVIRHKGKNPDYVDPI